MGLEESYTSGLARVICLESADDSTYLKAERHLEYTGGMTVRRAKSARVQRLGAPLNNGSNGPPTGRLRRANLYVSADGTGVPWRRRN